MTANACPFCGSALYTSEAHAGREIRCPRCEHAFTAAATGTTQAPLACGKSRWWHEAYWLTTLAALALSAFLVWCWRGAPTSRKTVDRRWLEDATQELEVAQAVRPQKSPLPPEGWGRLIERLRQEHGDILDTIPAEALKARKGQADLPQRIHRESLLRGPNPQWQRRLPWQARCDLYEEFADLTGLQEPWSLLGTRPADHVP